MDIKPSLENIDDPKRLAEMVLAYLGETFDDAMTTFAEDGSTMLELKERARAVLARS